MSPKHSESVRGAFNATFTPQTTPTSPGTIILFDNVQYNTGEYNPSTSVLSCPLTGLYVFYSTVHLISGDQGNIELIMDSTVVGRAAAYNHNNADYIGIHYCNQFTDVDVTY